jgi:succinylarginine dihydrolase
VSGAVEANFDGLVGPTHNYAGLSWGNVASQRHRASASNPRAAALEGLAKMQAVADLGVPQYVLPPHERPDVAALRRLGFGGTDADVLARARREDPAALAACASASAMWAANAATVAPGADTADGRVHVTPANLVAFRHRALEAPVTARLLRAILRDPARFVHHEPLPAAADYADEGAANHSRACARHGAPGVHVFTYGRRAAGDAGAGPARFPARQTLEASRAVARLHRLPPEATMFVRQSAAAIDAGVFHADVGAVGNERVLLFHERAWDGLDGVLAELRAKLRARAGVEPVLVRVREDEVPLATAVDTYLLNSQLVTVGDGAMCLLCPAECRENEATRRWLDDLRGRGTPIADVRFIGVRQSMQNGGGPACLRLRVELTAEERAGVHDGVRLTGALAGRLADWIARHYRDRLAPDDLADPALLDESRAALDELTRILGLGSVYRFQGAPSAHASATVT